MLVQSSIIKLMHEKNMGDTVKCLLKKTRETLKLFSMSDNAVNISLHDLAEILACSLRDFPH